MLKINKKNSLYALMLILLLLSACTKSHSIKNHSIKNHSIKPELALSSSTSLASLNNLYQYHLLDSHTKEPLKLSQLVKKLADSDVIFIGELHTHQASHLLQIQLLAALYQQNPRIILSMEQFSRQHQSTIDDYLEGKYGEKTLIDEAKAWENYRGSYRAVLEFAREHQIPVIAANAPSMFVRCVAKKGPDILNSLSSEQMAWAAKKLDLENPDYKKKFMSHMKQVGRSHGLEAEEQAKRQNNTFAAQLLRDTTMAESIANAKRAYPSYQVIHLNGAFHSDNHLGTVAILNDTLGGLKNTVISPASVEDNQNPSASEENFAQGDYIYLIQQLPARFLDQDKMNQSIMKLIKKRKKEECTL